MKLSIAVVASLVGMIGSSVGVTWAMGPIRAAEVVAVAPPRADAPAPTAEPPAAVGEAGTRPVADASFVREGVLRVEGRVGHAVLPADGTHETFVLLDVQAMQARDVQTRTPANIAIVLDRSASMRGQRMANAIAAVRGMLAQLRPDDTLSIVTYADKASLLLPPSTVRSLDLAAVADLLGDVRAGGHTCMSCGVVLARAQMRGRTDAVNRMLLLSDGLANRGLVEPSQFRELGSAMQLERMAIASIGVDIDYDERSLLALSENSNGRHYFVANTAGLGAVFEQERLALVGTVADGVDAEITLADGVELLEVVDRTHRVDGGRVFVSLGSFAAGEQRTALLRVRVGRPQGAATLADVRLAYRDLLADRREVADGVLGVRFEGSDVAPLDPAVDARLGRKDAFDALLSANAAFARGDVEATRRELQRARRSIVQRRSSNATPTPAVAADFERQIVAIDSAATGFDDAARDIRPTAAPAVQIKKNKKAKKVARSNAAAADPFSD